MDEYEILKEKIFGSSEINNFQNELLIEQENALNLAAK